MLLETFLYHEELCWPTFKDGKPSSKMKTVFLILANIGLKCCILRRAFLQAALYRGSLCAVDLWGFRIWLLNLVKVLLNGQVSFCWKVKYRLAEWSSTVFLNGPVLTCWFVQYGFVEWSSTVLLNGPVSSCWMVHYRLVEWSSIVLLICSVSSCCMFQYGFVE